MSIIAEVAVLCLAFLCLLSVWSVIAGYIYEAKIMKSLSIKESDNRLALKEDEWITHAATEARAKRNYDIANKLLMDVNFWRR